MEPADALKERHVCETGTASVFCLYAITESGKREITTARQIVFQNKKISIMLKKNGFFCSIHKMTSSGFRSGKPLQFFFSLPPKPAQRGSQNTVATE